MCTISHTQLTLSSFVHVGQQLGRIDHILDRIRISNSTTSTIGSDDDSCNNSCKSKSATITATTSTTKTITIPPNAAQRYHQWDGKNTLDLIPFTKYITNTTRRSMVESILHAFRNEQFILHHPTTPTTPHTPPSNSFRTGMIMGDYNDANIIMDPNTLQFNGVIDFGDSLER
jgi:hypothetical protein